MQFNLFKYQCLCLGTPHHYSGKYRSCGDNNNIATNTLTLGMFKTGRHHIIIARLLIVLYRKHTLSLYFTTNDT